MSTLEIHDLEMQLGGRVLLHGVSLHVEPGEVVGLSGVNGVGKSTLLKLAAGLLRPSDGRIRVRGVSPARARAKGWIGWSTSGEASFSRRLSLQTNLVTTARLSGVPRPVARVAEWAEILGFEDHLSRPAGCCSSGVRQRAALARALLHRPSLLLLDEPFRSVDAASARDLADRLRSRLCREAVIWVSHSRDELARVADRELRLENGDLVLEPTRLSPARIRAMAAA